MRITKISIQNPVFATMIMLVFLVLGYAAMGKMSVDQFPDINFPIVVVQTDYPGASPESVESDVTRKLEEGINTVSGLKNLTSRSYEGTSVIIAEFNLSVDPTKAANDIREKVALIKPLLKEGVKDSKTSRFDPADKPILSYGLQNTKMSFKALSSYAENRLKKRLETVRGVGQVNLVGIAPREVGVVIQAEKLKAFGVGIEAVQQALRNDNLDFPVGKIKDNFYERNIQIQSKFKSIEDFKLLPIARQGNSIVYLGDVATIYDQEKERESLALLDGAPVIGINILKAQGENTLQVASDIKARLEEIKLELPPGTVITSIRDGSRQIEASVKNVRNTIFEGAILTILIVFLFLNSWRSTVITGLTLPIALLGTFFFMHLFGFTINMITLMALSICVGLLIDDAIVVRENIVRHANMGKSHKKAALDGTKEIGLAVLATTFSIVAVFLPVGFMGGIIGRFFHQFGITVVVAVLISMFVSFTLDPMLSSVWPEPDKTGKNPNIFSRFALWFEGRMDALARGYQNLLRFSLQHRALTLLLSVALLAGSFFIPRATEFVPAADFSEMTVSFYTPVGSSLEHTRSKVLEAKAALKKIPEIKSVFATINSGKAAGKNYVSMTVNLTPKKERARSQQELTRPIREVLGQIAGITVSNAGAINAVGDDKLVMISLQGQNLDVLEKITKETMGKLRQIDGLVDLDSSLKDARSIYAVKVNREMATDLGISPQRLANVIEPLFQGLKVSTWRADDDEDYEVNIRLAQSDKTLEQLKSMPVISQGTQLITLSDIADVQYSVGANQINRKNLSREVAIDANTFGVAAGDVSVNVKKVLDSIKLPPGYQFVVGGSAKDMAESASYAGQALILGIIFIYMVLASQFGRFIQPLAIMASLPFTLIGVFLALFLWGSTLNLFSIIGVIMLMGLVTKNAILLIDYANILRSKHAYGKHDALIEAAKIRLRPILMTTLAMIFGMIPLATGLAEGAEQRAPMGQAIIGGVITSSLLTLVVVPVVYSLLEGLVERVANLTSGRSLLEVLAVLVRPLGRIMRKQKKH